jgi:hypothetical protein
LSRRVTSTWWNAFENCTVFKIPVIPGHSLVDKISYVIDVRERALDIPPKAITRTMYPKCRAICSFGSDPEKAAYGALNPLHSVTQHAQSAASAIGEMELDEIARASSTQCTSSRYFARSFEP